MIQPTTHPACRPGYRCHETWARQRDLRVNAASPSGWAGVIPVSTLYRQPVHTTLGPVPTSVQQMTTTTSCQ